jgi:RimJ/RimL family protein N-acetyltransferase
MPSSQQSPSPDATGMPWQERVPVLTDGVVRLRAHGPQDVGRIVEQCTDLESVLWTTVPRDYTADMARSWLEDIASDWTSDAERHWAIEEVDDPKHRFLGTIDIRPQGAGRSEIGFGLHPDARGRGLMAAAVKLACAHWFEAGGKRVDWRANRGNFASWAVARAAGFAWVATLPGHIPDGDGVLVDAWLASLEPGAPMSPRTPWFKVPVLEGEQVRLRPWRDEDEAVAEPHAHPSHHLPAGSIPTPETYLPWLLRRREQMAQGRSINWCVADLASDEPLGEVLVFVHEGVLTEGHSAELGAFLRPSSRGGGLAVEAGRLAVGHAFAPVAEGGLGLGRLVAETASDNDASIAVLRGLGFTQWGHEECAEAPDGTIAPADHWELLDPR